MGFWRVCLVEKIIFDLCPRDFYRKNFVLSPEFFKVRMFLNFYRKNLWFHNYFIILQRHRRFDGKDVCNRSIFLPFSPVFLLKAKVHCSDFFVFAIFIIVF